MTTSLNWTYPVYLIRHAGGYASVAVDPVSVDPVSVDPVSIDHDQPGPRFAICVFTTEALGRRFVEAVEIEGENRAVRSDREFAQLLRALKEPFTTVVFDAEPAETEINEKWRVDVSTLLEDHLPWADSPWDYPVYVLAQNSGNRGVDYASIEADVADRGPLLAIGLFLKKVAVDQYRQAADNDGRPQALDTPKQLADFLRDLPSSVTAVALNPRVVDGKHVARQCLSTSNLLEKILMD